MTTFKNFVIIGGGGGNEIENKLMVFDASNPGDIPANMLRKMICEEGTGKDVANFIDVAHVSLLFSIILIESQRYGRMYRPIYSNLQAGSPSWLPGATP